MKKIFALLTLFFFAFSAKSQTDTSKFRTYTLPGTLIMPDGSVIATKSLDSVKKVLGWDNVSFSLQDDGAHVHPIKSKDEQLKAEQKLNAHLNSHAPTFAFKDLTGKPYSLASLRGKIIVLNFWFTQCGGCVAEMPDLNELKNKYSGKDVVFLAITFDDTNKINAFLSTKKFDYFIIPNAKKVCLDYDIYGYPTSVVIDRNGIIKFINCSIDSNLKSQLTQAIDKIYQL